MLADPTGPAPAPVKPVPAATLVFLRDRAPGEVETLLIRRHANSRFAGGDWVFAGGKVDAHDVPGDVAAFCAGLEPAQAAAALGGGLTPFDALAYWVGAVREAFEEVGLLLAYGPDGDLIRLEAGAVARFEAHRKACQASNAAFFVMLRTERLTLATDRLAYFAHWITPEENPLRFDTRFFAAVAPPDHEARPDGHEITGVRWLTPREALEAMRRNEISLRTPTIKNLEVIRDAAAATAGGAAAVVASLRGREVPSIRPRVLTVDGKRTPVLPGDPRWY
jgi:8-oxo-dGTP pyrophosphatase MutT (NUDIX family)